MPSAGVTSIYPKQYGQRESSTRTGAAAGEKAWPSFTQGIKAVAGKVSKGYPVRPLMRWWLLARDIAVFIIHIQLSRP